MMFVMATVGIEPTTFGIITNIIFTEYITPTQKKFYKYFDRKK